jgi:N-acetylglucosaminyldiphosphoundecaprenol N-acetyl-beta-D-mannosaminyltransferase
MPELMKALNHPSAVTLPDGMPLVWAMRSWGAEIKDRVYGPDFFELCMSKSVESGFKHFLYGSTENTLEKLETNLKNKFENINISGSYSPPFRPLTSEEEEAVILKINDSGANIVWIGLGAPKQEVFVDKIAEKLNAPVVVAIGAAFDFHAGTVKQAPDWMQDHGLEWLYRLVQEPRRLWFRYCYYNPLFVIKYLIEKIKGKRGLISNNQ